MVSMNSTEWRLDGFVIVAKCKQDSKILAYSEWMVTVSTTLTFKNGPSPASISFQTNINNFYNKFMWINVRAGIRTHNFKDMSFLP